MSRLTEKYIQKKSINFLTELYKEKYELEKIFAKSEVCTNLKKRADGLICFNSIKQNEHTVSIEAKSHKTLGSLIAYWNDNKFSLHSISPAIIIGLFSLYLTKDLTWYFMALILLAVTIFIFVLIIFIITLRESDKYKLIDVITQLHQYPANEKWIAISKDSLNLAKDINNPDFQNKSDYENFLSVCKLQGIGLLIISRRKTEVLIKPNFSKGAFLDSYLISRKIRNKIKRR